MAHFVSFVGIVLSVLISKKGKLPQIPFFNIFCTDFTKHGEHFGI